MPIKIRVNDNLRLLTTKVDAIVEYSTETLVFLIPTLQTEAVQFTWVSPANTRFEERAMYRDSQYDEIGFYAYSATVFPVMTVGLIGQQTTSNATFSFRIGELFSPLVRIAVHKSVFPEQTELPITQAETMAAKINTFIDDMDELDLRKVDKIDGKGLSTNDFTNNDKNKLDGIEAGAEVNPYSKTQLDSMFDEKQDKLVAGKNIAINPDTNVISVTGEIEGTVDWENIDNKPELQDKLIAGDNITIDENTNTISASGGGEYELTKSKIETALEGIDNTAIQLGGLSSASGTYSTALGYGAEASGKWSTALGLYTSAKGHNSTAVGRNASATGDNSIALGSNSSVSGHSSIAFGQGVVVTEPNVADFGPMRQVRVNLTPVNDRDATSKKYVDNKNTIKEQNNNTNIKFWTGSQTEYDSLIEKDENTLYFIEEE